MLTIGFGGGCHWCTEAIFQALRGVNEVRQGFVTSKPPHDAWSEAVEVIFDPTIISLQDLLNIHLASHASTSDHKMRVKYRSAVYVFDSEQRAQAEAALNQASIKTDLEFITQILDHRGFKPSKERFHNYYETDPNRPFCQTYIDPKLINLRKRYAELMKPSD